MAEFYQPGYHGIPNNWGHMEAFLYGRLSEYAPDMYQDSRAQALYDAGFFHTGHHSSHETGLIQQELKDYLWTEYGIEFDAAFDWEDYRAWYRQA